MVDDVVAAGSCSLARVALLAQLVQTQAQVLEVGKRTLQRWVGELSVAKHQS